MKNYLDRMRKLLEVVLNIENKLEGKKSQLSHKQETRKLAHNFFENLIIIWYAF